ncbi:DUF4012 domain-containing protein [Microbacterium sp. HA-8]|uniref:DUF4012 domain-containing protein n=1 Tax=Microbacterium sp. HA-8 TaxID=3234200 RepID=UPI0038F5DE73
MTSQAASSRRARRGGSRARRARAGRITAITLGTLLIAAIAATAWIASRALAATEHLTTAQTLAGDIQNTLTTDPTAATTTATRLTEHTAAARAATDDPLYTAATRLPWIGPQLHALATITTSLDDLTADGLTPLLDVAADLDPAAFAPREGRIDLEPLTRMQDPAATAATAAAEAAASLHTLDTTTLIGALAAPVTQAQTLLDTVADGTDALHRATVLLPRVLGQNEPRDYLILFQNNAEWRSLGGIPGAVVVVHTDNGTLTLTGQDTAGNLPQPPQSILPLPADVQSLYGDDPGRFMQNVTQVPDFTVSAQLAREIWYQGHGQQVDGVIALDPVALSYLLAATGPVTLPTGDVLTSENAVQLLLNEVYYRYELPAEQDAFFASAASAVFGALTTAQADPVSLVGGLARAGTENRLLIWSDADDEQSVLDNTSLQGRLPVTDESATRFGVYVNDGTSSKMDYYARLETSTAWCRVYAPGQAAAALRVTLRSDAPADAATSLPGHITGYGTYYPMGLTRVFTYVYLPRGSTLISEAVTVGTLGPGSHDGLQVVTWITDLWPGEKATLDLLVQAPLTEELEVVATPTLGTSSTQPEAKCG